MTPEMEHILKLVSDLRWMDQRIYCMSQCMTWQQMQPIFEELLAETNRRMKEESDRIRMLLVPEIVRTYAKPKEEGSAKDGHPRLEGPRDAIGKKNEGRED